MKVKNKFSKLLCNIRFMCTLQAICVYDFFWWLFCKEGEGIIYIYQGWDSSAFTWISVEQKLKSVVDDDHFHGKKINKKTHKNIQSNLSPYLAGPHSVVFSSYSRMCTRVALLFWLSKMSTRTDIITRAKSFDETGVKNDCRWQWAGRKIDDENIGQFIWKTWNYVLWSCLCLSIF